MLFHPQSNARKQEKDGKQFDPNLRYIVSHCSTSDFGSFFFGFNCYFDKNKTNYVRKYDQGLSVFTCNEEDYCKIIQFNGNYDIFKAELLIAPCKCTSLFKIIDALVNIRKSNFRYYFRNNVLDLSNILQKLSVDRNQMADESWYRLILFLFAVGMDEDRKNVHWMMMDNNAQMGKGSLDGLAFYFPCLNEITLKGCNISRMDLSDVELNLINENHQKIDVVTGYLDQIKKKDFRNSKIYPIKKEYAARPIKRTFDDYQSCMIDVSENDLNNFIYTLFNIQWNDIQKSSFFYLDESVFSYMVSDELLDSQTYLGPLFLNTHTNLFLNNPCHFMGRKNIQTIWLMLFQSGFYAKILSFSILNLDSDKLFSLTLHGVVQVTDKLLTFSRSMIVRLNKSFDPSNFEEQPQFHIINENLYLQSSE